MLLILRSIWADDSGQDLAEYALLIALIALVVIGAITLLGEEINAVFTDVAGRLGGE